MAFAALNYSKICHVYNVYGGINRGINKKEGTILRYFDVRHMDSATTYRALHFSNQSEASFSTNQKQA